MTYAAQQQAMGRKPLVVCELLYDACSKDYGQGSTNLLTYSEQFDNAAWTKTATVTANTTAAPDGLQTADTVEDSSIVAHQNMAQAASSYVVTNYYCASIFIAKDSDTSRFPMLRLVFSGSTYEAHDVSLNTKTGEIHYWDNIAGAASYSYGIKEFADYWEIYVYSISNDASNTVCYLELYPSVGSVLGTYDVAATGSVAAWGAQVAQGSGLQHYTPTTTASASSSCTASGASGSECYNTRKTCQDSANFSKIIKCHRFCQPHNDLPVAINMFPAMVDEPKLAAGRITPGKGLGYRSTIQIKLRDFTHHDRGIDPYVSTRSYTPEEQGTFWGKFLARNPYFNGRKLRVRAGYIADTFDWVNFQDRIYIIDTIKGPDRSGTVTVTAKDPITLADDKKAQCPVPSTGKLLAGITDSATSFTLTPTGIGNSEYPASGTVRIGSEEITFTRSGDAVTVVSRAVNGTEAKSHSADDIVQLCKVYTSANIIDVIDDLLNNFVDGFDAANWIPYDQGISGPATGTDDEWDEEKALYLSSTSINRTIGKPTGVNKLISALAEQYLFNIYWDEIDQEIKIKAIAPPKGNASVPQLDEDNHILQDSFRLSTDEKQRVSQVWIYFNKINNSEDSKPENYKNLYIGTDLNQEDDNLYGKKQVVEIYADWITTEAQAAQLAGRILARFFEPPKLIDFALDAKDADKKPGGLVDVTSRFIQDEAGANELTRFEILEVNEKQQGHRFEYKAMVSAFNGLYGFIGPDTLNDYSSESAANKQAYAFICPDSGTFADGTAGYKII